MNMFLGSSFPHFHHFDISTGAAASVKSFDTSAPAWQTRNGLANKLRACIDDIDHFDGGVTENDVQIIRTMVKSKILRVAIPDAPLSQWQKDALDAAKAYANGKVKVIVTVIK